MTYLECSDVSAVTQAVLVQTLVPEWTVWTLVAWLSVHTSVWVPTRTVSGTLVVINTSLKGIYKHSITVCKLVIIVSILKIINYK